MMGVVVWITGLPASGKSTLAARIRERLVSRRSCVVLDGDEIREALGAHAYGTADRDELYSALSRLAAIIARQELVVLVAATAPRRAHRELARSLAPRFVEVYVETPLAECERRDPKGLYARARAGDAPMLPGVGASYEAPESPEVIARDGRDDKAVDAVEHLAVACEHS
jgi:adenylylsulfate kinase